MAGQRTISFVSHCTVDFIDDLKLVSLYFDKVFIPGNLIISLIPPPDGIHIKGRKEKVLVEHPYIDEHYRSALAILENEGIVEVKNDLIDHLPGRFYEYPSYKSIYDLYKSGYTIYQVQPDGSQKKVAQIPRIGPAKYEIKGEYVEELSLLDKNFDSMKELRKNDKEFFAHSHVEDIPYYVFIQANRIVQYIGEGQTVLTTSEAIDNRVKEQLNGTDGFHTQTGSSKMNLPKASIELLKIYLPNISKLSIGDVLEAKFRARDELLGLNQKMSELEYELARIDIQDFNATHYLNKFVIPQVNDLSRKMKSIDHGLGAKILNELKNPFSYSPLLLSITDIPKAILILVNLGLISASAMVEHSKNRTELKTSGFHYLLNLRSKVR